MQAAPITQSSKFLVMAKRKITRYYNILTIKPIFNLEMMNSTLSIAIDQSKLNYFQNCVNFFTRIKTCY